MGRFEIKLVKRLDPRPRVNMFFTDELVELYDTLSFQSDSYNVRKFLVSREYNGKLIIPTIPPEVSPLVIFTYNGKGIHEWLVVEDLNKFSSITIFILSTEMYPFTYASSEDETKYEKWFKSNNIRVFSYSLHNKDLWYDYSLWELSFDWQLKTLVKLHKEDEDKKFKSASKRIGIHIHRRNTTRDTIVKGCIYHNGIDDTLLITLKNIGELDITEDDRSIINEYLDLYDLHTEMKMPKNIDKFYEELFRLTQCSQSEIVMETWLENCDPLYEKFTEKTLRLLVAGKPFMFSDPYSYRLWKDYGLETYDELYGKELTDIYNTFSCSDKKLRPYLYDLIYRIKQLADLPEVEWKSIYTKSLERAERNRIKHNTIIPIWKNIDKLINDSPPVKPNKRIYTTYNEQDNIFSTSLFEQNKYEVVYLQNYSVNDVNNILDRVDDGDIFILFVNELFNKFKGKINTAKNIIIIAANMQEVIDSNVKRDIITMYNTENCKVYFLNTILQSYFSEYELSFQSGVSTFSNLFGDINYIDKDRTQKYNFFNRSMNIRRLKVYELLKRNGYVPDTAYTSFGMILLLSTAKSDIKCAKDYLELRNGNLEKYKELGLEIDVDYIDSFVDEFSLLDYDREYIRTNFNGPELSQYQFINNLASECYAGFAIESSEDTFRNQPIKVSEKTIRFWFYRQIFLTLQERGLTSELNKNGIETFEDVFGLNKNWDETENELERIHLFVKAILWFNSLSLDEIKKIYNTPHIKLRLQKNYQFVVGAFNKDNLSLEILNKIS
jgi:hypothetical protein